MKTFLSIAAMQLFFAALLILAVFMGQKADAKCKPEPPPVLKDCHPYPAAGPNAIQCIWVPGKQITPWAPPKCETR
jgi:hypothetical protein